jgi:hypothetical protein
MQGTYFFLPWVWRARISALVSGVCTSTDLRLSCRCWSLLVVVGRPRRAHRGPGGVTTDLQLRRGAPPAETLHPLPWAAPYCCHSGALRWRS